MPPKASKTTKRAATPPSSGVPAALREDPEPTAEEEGAAIVLVRTGYIRVVVGGQVYRLRPPLMGEHLALRGALETAYEEIEDLSIEVQVENAAIQSERAAIADDEQLPPAEAKWTPVERIHARRALRDRDIAAGRRLSQFQDEAMTAWWVKVWDTLLDSGDRPAWLDGDDRSGAPTWFSGALLPNQVIAHWRAAPLVRTVSRSGPG